MGGLKANSDALSVQVFTSPMEPVGRTETKGRRLTL